MALLGDHDQELQPLNPVHPPANSAALAPHEVEEGARVPVRKHSLHEAIKKKDVTEMKRLLELMSQEEINEYDASGLTALHYAVENNCLGAMELFFYKRADFSIKTRDPDRNHETPLHRAAKLEKGSVEMIKTLIENGALKQIEDARGQIPYEIAKGKQKQQEEMKAISKALHGKIKTSLHLCRAIKDGHDEEMDRWLKLIEKNEIDECDGSGLAPLHYAVMLKRWDIMESLFYKRADFSIKTSNSEGETPLHLAAKLSEDADRKKMIKLLIENGAQETENAEGITPSQMVEGCEEVLNGHKKSSRFLCRAIRDGNESEMTTFIQDAEINECDDHGLAPLHYAVKLKRLEIIQSLCEKGANCSVKASHSHETPLHIAAALDSKILSILLDCPPYNLEATNSSSKTCLHSACGEGNIACVQLLLKKTAILNSRDDKGETPLHFAAKNGHVLVVKELLKCDADLVKDQDNRLNTALYFACRYGHYKVAVVLLEANADPNVKNQFFYTPLDCATVNGHENIVQLLINHGAEVDCKDKKDCTPLMKACKSGYAKVADILIRNKANVSNKDRAGCNALDIAIDEGHENVAMVIATSTEIEKALRNSSFDRDSGFETTPMRKLIVKMPDVLEVVFKRCLNMKKKTINKFGRETEVLTENFNFEFLEDFHYTDSTQNNATSWCPKGYSSSNHCLHLMTISKSRKLLKHPLVTSLVDYKWRNYAAWMNLIFFLIYVVFISFLTAFAITALPPGTSTCAQVRNGNDSSVNCTTEAPESRLLFVPIAGAVVIIFSIIGIIIEVIQMFKSPIEYFTDWFNYLEVFMFLFSFIFAWVFTTTCFCPAPWQWQIGSLGLFLAWIDMVKHLKKVPFVGIYPFVYLNITYKLLFILVLAVFLVLAFAFSFYMLFYDPNQIVNGIYTRTAFDNPWRAIMKTLTMTTGEFDFDVTFRQDNNQGRDIQYPFASNVLWILFIIMMPILLTNLLIGLAVDAYTSGIKEDAEIENIVLKIKLILSAEEFLPRSWRCRLNKPNREMNHVKFLGWKALNIKRPVYERFEEAHKYEYPKKVPLEELSGKVEKIESQLENMTNQQNKLVKLMESMSTSLEDLNRIKGQERRRSF